MDRRQKRTRAAIFNAFTGLLLEKSFANITVQEIIDAADIGRSTFYSHFETKDELLKVMCTDIFDHVFSEVSDPENTHDFSGSHGEMEEKITHLLYHLRDNKKRIVGILNSESAELFLKYFTEYLNRLLSDGLLTGVYEDSVPRDFLISHITGSFVNAVRWWIKNDMETPPEKVSEYFLSVIKYKRDGVQQDMQTA